jgi:hypothetical protein
MDEHKLITGNNIITKQMGGAAFAPEPSYVIEKKHEEDILEIFSHEINNAILNIKQKLGTNIADTNQNADAIMKMLNTLQQMIDYKTQENGINPDQIGTFPDSIGIEKNLQNLYNIKQSDVYFVRNKLLNKSFEINNNINTLDTPNKTEFEDSKPNKTAEDIQTRLNNCHILEMLYLIKHEEVMKTFAFTLNLFDKYKYSVKLLLFVLKYLVVKKKPEDEKHAAKESFVDVKLPKTLIPNIQTLLADQEKVQEVITVMKEQLETNPLGGVNGSQVLNPAGGPKENVLDKSLSNLTR